MTARKIIYLALLLPALLSCSRSGLHCSRDGRVYLDGEDVGWLEAGCAPGIVYDLELSREDDQFTSFTYRSIGFLKSPLV